MFELLIMTAVGVAPIQLATFHTRTACEKERAVIKTYEAVVHCREIIVEKKNDKLVEVGDGRK